MARTYNTVVLSGYVGSDPKVRETSKGTRVANFTIATHDGYGDNENTNWHNCVAWAGLAGVIEDYVEKGDRLLIEGRIEYRPYEKDGVTVKATNIVVDEMVMLGGRNSGSKGKSSKSSDDPWGDEDVEDDLPF